MVFARAVNSQAISPVGDIIPDVCPGLIEMDTDVWCYEIPSSILEKNQDSMVWGRYPKTAFTYSEARAELLSRSLAY